MWPRPRECAGARTSKPRAQGRGQRLARVEASPPRGSTPQLRTEGLGGEGSSEGVQPVTAGVTVQCEATTGTMGSKMSVTGMATKFPQGTAHAVPDILSPPLPQRSHLPGIAMSLAADTVILTSMSAARTLCVTSPVTSASASPKTTIWRTRLKSMIARYQSAGSEARPSSRRIPVTCPPRHYRFPCAVPSTIRRSM